jgi:cysteine desulfurase / selenocysteine lyase
MTTEPRTTPEATAANPADVPGTVAAGHEVDCHVKDINTASSEFNSETTNQLSTWRSGLPTSETWIHMNAAGASPMCKKAYDAMRTHLDLELQVGGYEAAGRLSVAGTQGGDHAVVTRPSKDPRGGRACHQAVARLVNAESSDEIALCESAQAAWHKAVYSLEFTSADRIICFESEYAGNAIAFLQIQKRTGVQLVVLPMKADGVVDVDALRAALESGNGSGNTNASSSSSTTTTATTTTTTTTSTTASVQAKEGSAGNARTLVALTHIQTDSCIVQPAEAVGALCRKHGAVFVLDACQSVGQIPIDVRALKCDFLCGEINGREMN